MGEKYHLQITDVYIDTKLPFKGMGPKRAGGVDNMKNYKIAVAGTGARDIIGTTKRNYDN